MIFLIFYLYMVICTGIALIEVSDKMPNWLIALSSIFWFVPVTIGLLVKTFEE